MTLLIQSPDRLTINQRLGIESIISLYSECSLASEGLQGKEIIEQYLNRINSDFKIKDSKINQTQKMKEKKFQLKFIQDLTSFKNEGINIQKDQILLLSSRKDKSEKSTEYMISPR